MYLTRNKHFSCACLADRASCMIGRTLDLARRRHQLPSLASPLNCGEELR